jgi:hypothetical protein
MIEKNRYLNHYNSDVSGFTLIFTFILRLPMVLIMLHE